MRLRGAKSTKITLQDRQDSVQDNHALENLPKIVDFADL